MADDDCDCPEPNVSRSATRRPKLRMGVSSLSRPPIQPGRSLPLSMPIPPRPRIPPRFPPTVPGQSRAHSSGQMDSTLTPGSADRTLRPTDMDIYEETMEELTRLEYVEEENVKKDLIDFQNKRRKLVFDLLSLKFAKAKKSIQKALNKSVN